MKRCVVVTVDVRDSEVDEEAGGLLVGYERNLRYTVVVHPQVGESQPMLMERCSSSARDLYQQLSRKHNKTTP